MIYPNTYSAPRTENTNSEAESIQIARKMAKIKCAMGRSSGYLQSQM